MTIPYVPTDTICSDRHGSVLCITIGKSSANGIALDARIKLNEAIEAADSDTGIAAVLLVFESADFMASADIREFGQPPQPALLAQVCNRIESCSKPVVAAIQGNAMGAALEIMLAAHYRLAVSQAKLGLPGVQLGLMPGAGGTVRAPRLIGARAALDLMLSGRSVDANESLSLGLVDRLAEAGQAARAAGIAYAQELLAQNAGVRRTRDAQGLADRAAAQAAVDAAKVDLGKKSRGLLAPLKIIETVQTALDQPFDEALALEGKAFLACSTSAQHAGLLHARLAEREVSQVPEAKSSHPRLLKRIGVVGGGTMGAGITVAALDAGLPVVMIERDLASIERGRANVEKVYDSLVAKGRLTPEAKAVVMAGFTGSTDYDALADVDLVIEAVFEDIDAKKAVFKELDRVCRPGAVLATNTSYLDIDAIAASISRPQDVIGLHFFSPANIMKLLEIVVPAKVSADVVATAFALAKRMKKMPVRAGVCDGFIGNRILAAYKQAADYIMEDGASPYEIDAAVREFGYPMGPFQVTDLAGGDIGWATRKRRAATRDPKARYVEVADRVCERGWFGQKTGRGFYLYPQGARVGHPDPEVLAIVEAERMKKGITPRQFTAEEIVRRYMAAMVNEGAKVVDEGIALRPLDVDVTFLNGYGFPRYRGGPMKYADTVGLPKILQDIRRFEKEDPVFWKPAALLERLVEQNKDFASLN